MIKKFITAPLFSISSSDELSRRRSEPPPGGTAFYVDLSDGMRLRICVWNPDGDSAVKSILYLTGRRTFIEFYYEIIHSLVERGFQVFAFDWRGQGMSSRMLAERRKGHIDSFATYTDDLGQVVKDVVQPRVKGSLHLLAHSMGAHIALRSMQEGLAGFAPSIFLAPMLDIRAGGLPKPLLRLVLKLSSWTGGPDSYLWGQGEDIPSVFEENLLTSDPDKFRDYEKFTRACPDLALGGVTNAWMSAALASIKLVNQDNRIERVDTPITMIAAEDDRVVSNKTIARVVRKNPRFSYVTLAGARHEIHKERDAVLRRFWRLFDERIPPPA